MSPPLDSIVIFAMVFAHLILMYTFGCPNTFGEFSRLSINHALLGLLQLESPGHYIPVSSMKIVMKRRLPQPVRDHPYAKWMPLIATVLFVAANAAMSVPLGYVTIYWAWVVTSVMAAYVTLYMAPPSVLAGLTFSTTWAFTQSPGFGALAAHTMIVVLQKWGRRFPRMTRFCKVTRHPAVVWVTGVIVTLSLFWYPNRYTAVYAATLGSRLLKALDYTKQYRMDGRRHTREYGTAIGHLMTFLRYPVLTLKYQIATVARRIIRLVGSVRSFATNKTTFLARLDVEGKSINPKVRLVATHKYGLTGDRSYWVGPYVGPEGVARIARMLQGLPPGSRYITVLPEEYLYCTTAAVGSGPVSLYGTTSKEWHEMAGFYADVLNAVQRGDWEQFLMDDMDLLHGLNQLVDQDLLRLHDVGLSKLNLYHLVWLLLVDKENKVGFKAAARTCTTNQEFNERYRADLQDVNKVAGQYVYRGSIETSKFRIDQDAGLVDADPSSLNKLEQDRQNILRADPTLKALAMYWRDHF